MTAEYRNVCLRNLRQMVEVHTSGVVHADLEPSRIIRDERDVQALLDLLENSWINPFSCINPFELVCLSTASAAPKNVRDDLIHAKAKGEDACRSFRENRIETEEPALKFNDRIPKQKLKTFSDMQRSSGMKTTNREVMIKADQKLFGHMVLVASSRNLDMREVLKHPLGPLPWSLANCDGTMKKTNKSTLARHLEKQVSHADVIPSPSACIIDAMALLHKINAEKKTFGDLAEIVFALALKDGTHSDRIDMIFDFYKDISIKNAERNERSSSGAFLGNILSGQKIMRWRSILGCSTAKTSVIKFLCDEWKKPSYLTQLGDKVMYIACQEDCVKIDREGTLHIPELATSQEEADTRILLHAKHASPDHEAIIVVSEDTVVIILALAFFRQIGKIYVRCGSQARTRYIDISKLGTSLGEEICEGLLGLHAFTGCDTVSAFGGRGKLSAFKLIMKDKNHLKAMTQLGEHWDLSPELVSQLQRFTCRLYAASSSIANVNELRYQLFRAKKGDIGSCQLPPCADCLHLHALRANYQTGIWHRSLQKYPNVPSPKSGHGWVMDGDQLSIEWLRGPPAPEIVLEFMACKCTKVCKLPLCQCLVNNFKCTPACKLQTCENMDQDEDNIDLSGSESLDEDSDDGDWEVDKTLVMLFIVTE